MTFHQSVHARSRENKLQMERERSMIPKIKNARGKVSECTCRCPDKTNWALQAVQVSRAKNARGGDRLLSWARAGELPHNGT